VNEKRNGPPFLTVKEVAVIMRLSKMSVYRLIHSGELEAIRVGRGFRVPEQGLHDYMRGSVVVPDRSPVTVGASS
jgi:excisionase family DNA binding protein